MQLAQYWLGQGDREEGLRHITEAHADLNWAKRQLSADLGPSADGRPDG